MYKFGKKSKERLATCHPDLQLIMNDLIQIMDVSIVCGHRTEEEQTEAFNKGFSKVQYPNSKHNSSPSMAVDVIPYPEGYSNREKFYEMAGMVKAIAHKHGIKIKWGGEFKNFFDAPHFQLEK